MTDSPEKTVSRETTAPAAAVVPDRAALEGLEAKWAAQWKADGTYAFDRTRPAQRGLLDRHSPANGLRLAARRPRVLLHPHRPDRPLPADAGQVGLLPDGLGRQRPADRAPGAELLRRALRPVPALRRGLHPAREAGPKRQMPISWPNFIELCERLVEEDEKVFEDLWRTLGLSVDWKQHYTTIGPKAAEGQPARVPAQLRPRRGLPAGGADAVGRHLPDRRRAGRARGPRVPGAYHRVAFHGADGPVHIETTRPELIPSVVALIAHPDDERYQPLFGATVTSPVFGVEIPVLAHPAAEPDKGAGIAMCCTFGDLTDVTWWRELQLPVRTLIGRDGGSRARPPSGSPPPAARGVRRAPGQDRFSAREAMVALLRESGDPTESRRRPRDGELYEKGDKPLEIVSTRQW